jgi:hypothetical protein
MDYKELIGILSEQRGIKVIEVEDYNGNTILNLDLSKLDIADVEGNTLRLQLNEEN